MVNNERHGQERRYAPVSLFCTLLYTASARSFRFSCASVARNNSLECCGHIDGQIEKRTVQDIVLVRFQLPRRTLRIRRHLRQLRRPCRVRSYNNHNKSTPSIRLRRRTRRKGTESRTVESPTVDVCGHQSPVDERVVDEGFEDGHERFFVLPEHGHRDLARIPEATLDAADLQPSRRKEKKSASTDTEKKKTCRDAPPSHASTSSST